MTMSHGSIPINSSLFDLIYSIFFMEEIFNYHKTMKYNPLFLRKMIRYERVSVLERENHENSKYKCTPNPTNVVQTTKITIMNTVKTLFSGFRSSSWLNQMKSHIANFMSNILKSSRGP